MATTRLLVTTPFRGLYPNAKVVSPARPVIDVVDGHFSALQRGVSSKKDCSTHATGTARHFICWEEVEGYNEDTDAIGNRTVAAQPHHRSDRTTTADMSMRAEKTRVWSHPPAIDRIPKKGPSGCLTGPPTRDERCLFEKTMSFDQREWVNDIATGAIAGALTAAVGAMLVPQTSFRGPSPRAGYSDWYQASSYCRSSGF